MRLIQPLRARPAAALTAVVLAAVVAAPGGPVALAARGCKVTNTTTKATKGNLQAAVDAAKPGQTLEVRGTCKGSTTIGKRLKIVGKASKALGKPALVGPGTERVILVSAGATVTIATLTIRGGDVSHQDGYPANAGGGIRSEGTLTLRSVIIRGNWADQGGGISTNWSLTLTGSTRITGNRATSGGGLHAEGETATPQVLITGTSRIDHNTASQGGGGVSTFITHVTMGASSQVDHNTAAGDGGGFDQRQSGLEMGARSHVHHNTATTGTGGGVRMINGKVAMAGASRVSDNTSGTWGGGFNIEDGSLRMGGEAQVDHNLGRREAGGIEIGGDLTMNDRSSIHHNTGFTTGGVGLWSTSEDSTIVMNDRSSVHHNMAADPGGTAALTVIGDLTMNDDSVIRDHTGLFVRSAVDIWARSDPITPSITMTGRSRIRDNDLAPGLGALTLWPDCGPDPTATGITSRVVHNTPKNIFTATGC